MPWYKFYCTYGAGHQGRGETYRYYTHGASSTPEQVDECLREEWYEWCRQEWIQDPIGGWYEVQELPEDERRRQIQAYRSRVLADLQMLFVLGAEED